MIEKFTPIGKYLDQVKREVILKPEIKYNLLGVRWYGKGVFIRESKLGKEIKATKLYKIEKVDLLMSKIATLEAQVNARKEQAGQLMQAMLREVFEGNLCKL